MIKVFKVSNKAAGLFMVCCLLATNSVFAIWNPFASKSSGNPFNLFRSNKDNFNTCTNPENCNLGIDREEKIYTNNKAYVDLFFKATPHQYVGIKAQDGTKYIGHNDHALKWAQRWYLMGGINYGILAGALALFAGHIYHEPLEKNGRAVAVFPAGTSIMCAKDSLCNFSHARNISNIRASLKKGEEQQNIPYEQLSATRLGDDKDTINSRQYFWQIFPKQKKYNTGQMQ